MTTATLPQVAVRTTNRCGFCQTGTHDRCAIGTKMERHAKYPNGVVWACGCWDGSCETRSRLKCAHCGNKVEDEIEPRTWLCKDTEACHAFVTARRESDPFLAQLKEIRSTAMAKIENEKATTKTKAAPKTGTCVCGCNGTTKGGLFLPGHDARFVSTLVGEVESARFTGKATDAARKTLTSKKVSDRLVAKFEKSVGLAKDRAQKKADAKAAKDAEKAEKASA